ncbi:regulator of microtubule dynamics protein 1-like isoform X1 [Maniola jurtina]|uniref:regulator of microtubule dynamics protein 1-like isoform X1 n=2 Tax=Maniola jurtina TaxID=191418 RepID=UPI001E68C18C|nr:regulator of microtubule dynamics protein 1-like isoform X1 [Maniola jurtina]
MNIHKVLIGRYLFNLYYVGKVYKTILFQTSTYTTKKGVKLWRAGLIFSWPTIIKHNNINSDKRPTVAPTILDTADGVFDMGRYEECYNILINCKDPEDIEVKWRLCRVLYNMAKDAKYDEQYKRAIISQAHEIITSELERNWDNFAVHKWYALTLDAKSSIGGVKEKIKQLENVKKHMDLAVTLNPNDASLLHMLGEWCFQVTELPWHQRKTIETLFASLPYSTYEDALEYFLRAEAAQPRFYSINLLRIGCCYLKLDKGDQAKYYLKLAASYPAKSNDDHRANKEAAELLKK